MPRRPPKKWFYESVRAVKKYNPDVDDPAALVAWVWYHHARPGTKNRILQKEEISRYVKHYKKEGVNTMAKRRKKKWTASARKAFARRMKAARAAKHSPKRKITRRKVKRAARVVRRAVSKLRRITRTLTKGKSMARRRKHARRGFRRIRGFEGFSGFDGFEGRKRRRHRSRRAQIIIKGRRRHRRRGLLMGGTAGTLVQRIGGNAMNTAVGVAGAVGGAYLSNMIPVADNRIKAGLAALAGITLASSVRMPALRHAGIGLAIMGGLSLVRQMAPTLPLLTGEGCGGLALPLPMGATMELPSMAGLDGVAEYQTQG